MVHGGSQRFTGLSNTSPLFAASSHARRLTLYPCRNKTWPMVFLNKEATATIGHLPPLFLSMYARSRLTFLRNFRSSSSNGAVSSPCSLPNA